MTTIPETHEKDNTILQCCAHFIKRFRVNHILRSARATKEKGVPVYELFAFLMGLVFTGKNFYTLLENAREKVSFGKDAVYRFLNKSTINWELFLMTLSISVITKVNDLTSKDRKTVLIFDDSPYKRNRSKKVELLSRCFDHVTRTYYKGLTLLSMGWSDGQTFLPVSFRLLASGKDKNLLEGSHVKEDNRTRATKRRKDARKEKPALVLEMLKAVKGTKAQAKYVLFDSWFSSPSSILSVRGLGYHIVTRLKNHENFRYLYKGDILPISKIYKANKKRSGRLRYLLSVEVAVEHKDFLETVPAKIVYIRDKGNRKNWIALLSTDTTLSEDEIVALYGKRWDIEPFHKVLKSYLRLEKEFQTRSYDAMTAHATIVFSRYIFLSLESRESKDPRSVCALFHAICQELEDISFLYAFNLILTVIKQCATDYLHMTSTALIAFVEHFFDCLPLFIKDKLLCRVCES